MYCSYSSINDKSLRFQSHHPYHSIFDAKNWNRETSRVIASKCGLGSKPHSPAPPHCGETLFTAVHLQAGFPSLPFTTMQLSLPNARSCIRHPPCQGLLLTNIDPDLMMRIPLDHEFLRRLIAATELTRRSHRLESVEDDRAQARVTTQVERSRPRSISYSLYSIVQAQQRGAPLR